MTFIIGWKCNNFAYLCADSAITGAPDYAPCGSTSFGELNVKKFNYSVQEAALKIIQLDKIAIAYAGIVRSALDCIQTIKASLDSGDAPTIAFNKAVKSHTPLVHGEEFKFIAILAENGLAKLLSFNLANDQKIQQHGDGCIFAGSLPHHHGLDIANKIGAIIFEFKSKPRMLLAIALSLLQKMGITNYLMESHVGGVFSGAYADHKNIYRQSSTIFCIVNSENAADLILVDRYDDALATSSSFIDFNKVLLNGMEKYSDLKKANIRKRNLTTYGSGKFEYVVLLGLRFDSIVVIEMKKALTAKSCEISTEINELSVRVIVKPSLQAYDHVQGVATRERNNILGTYIYFFEHGRRD